MESCLSEDFEQVIQMNETEFQPRVVSGFPAKLGDVPYQVGFKIPAKGSRTIYTTFCGGVIVGRSKILTAAHCFEKKNKKCSKNNVVITSKELSRFYAVAGSLLNKEKFNNSIQGTSQWRRLKKAVYPCSYKFPNNDICIVITKKPFIYNSFVSPLPYASKYKNYMGECLVSGYGSLSKPFVTPKSGSEQLMLANLALMPAKSCNRRHHKSMHSFICTSDIVTDVGKGDSGGPLVCSNTKDPKDKGYGVVVGIVSGNKKTAGPFFTRVSSYYDYIRKNKASHAFVYRSFCLELITAIYWKFHLF